MKLLDFMIVGAQKSGTTALSEFLNQHSEIQMAEGKEVHLFDAEGFSSDWTFNDIADYYKDYFPDCEDSQLLGEATPIYLYLPEIASHLARYNPRLKIIVMLRDPVERAYSHYRMERERGNEYLPFWLSLLLESYRLNRDAESRDEMSSLRRHSYRSRGVYSRQLENLYQFFPEDQVLVVANESLRNDHKTTLDRVFTFLGVASEEIADRTVFSQGISLREVPVSAYLLRKSYSQEFNQLSQLLDFSVDHWR